MVRWYSGVVQGVEQGGVLVGLNGLSNALRATLSDSCLLHYYTLNNIFHNTEQPTLMSALVSAPAVYRVSHTNSSKFKYLQIIKCAFKCQIGLRCIKIGSNTNPLLIQIWTISVSQCFPNSDEYHKIRLFNRTFKKILDYLSLTNIHHHLKRQIFGVLSSIFSAIQTPDIFVLIPTISRG